MDADTVNLLAAVVADLSLDEGERVLEAAVDPTLSLSRPGFYRCLNDRHFGLESPLVEIVDQHVEVQRPLTS